MEEVCFGPRVAGSILACSGNIRGTNIPWERGNGTRVLAGSERFLGGIWAWHCCPKTP